MEIISQASPEKIKVGTLFFGGGTPSLLSVSHLESILSMAKERFNLQDDSEITLEANPGTVSQSYLQEISKLGINRISFGMQSAHVDELRTLNRLHRHEDVIQAVKWSKQAGIKHINLDLIFGIPGQTLEHWQDSLELALHERVDHFSLYSLSIEEGTPMQSWVTHGLVNQPDEDLSADMYELAMEELEQAGFNQYEISNWALEAQENSRCRHNLQYWRSLPYLGFGAGAHGFDGKTRTANVNGIVDYINLVTKSTPRLFPAGPACEIASQLSDWDLMQEFMMVGLRLTEEGISRSNFEQRFNHSLDTMFESQINKLRAQGLIEDHPQNPDRLRMTRSGRFFGNRVFMEFVGNSDPFTQNELDQ